MSPGTQGTAVMGRRHGRPSAMPPGPTSWNSRPGRLCVAHDAERAPRRRVRIAAQGDPASASPGSASRTTAPTREMGRHRHGPAGCNPLQSTGPFSGCARPRGYSFLRRATAAEPIEFYAWTTFCSQPSDPPAIPGSAPRSVGCPASLRSGVQAPCTIPLPIPKVIGFTPESLTGLHRNR